MRPNFTLPELQTRLDRLDQGAMLGISDPDFEWLFAKRNDVAAARLFQSRFAARDTVVGSRSVCVGEPLEAERAPPFALPRPVQCWTRCFSLVLLRSTMTIAE